MAVSALVRETTYVQNPALGAVLVWRFCEGYAQEHKTSEPPALQLVFLIIPILFHRDTFEELSGTRAGIHAFADKFSRSDTSKSDILLGIQDRVSQFRDLTLESVQLAIHCRLVTIIPSSGKLVSLSSVSPSSLPGTIRPLVAGAEKLGKWFAGMTLFEIENILKVAF
jgi:hypothetical protein